MAYGPDTDRDISIFEEESNPTDWFDHLQDFERDVPETGWKPTWLSDVEVEQMNLWLPTGQPPF